MLDCISLRGFDETDKPGTLLGTEIPMNETQIQTQDNSYQLMFKGLHKSFQQFRHNQSLVLRTATQQITMLDSL